MREKLAEVGRKQTAPEDKWAVTLSATYSGAGADQDLLAGP
jgi:hypothetical protein